MKYPIKFIVLFFTWPVVLIAFFLLCLVWLCLYCWGQRDKDFMASADIKTLAYCLWHFKVKEEKGD